LKGEKESIKRARTVGGIANSTKRANAQLPIVSEPANEQQWDETAFTGRGAEIKPKALLQQLRALTAHLESVREAERIEIAREVHDVLGQALTALKIDISWLNKHLDESKGFDADPSDLKIRLNGATVLLDETLAAVKNLLSELRPRVLDAFGLGAAIEWLCSDFQRLTGIACSCRASEIDPPLSTEKSTALFRIVQESLTNVAKHSQATKVKAVIKRTCGELVISVKDNGTGITAANLAAFHAFRFLVPNSCFHELRLALLNWVPLLLPRTFGNKRSSRGFVDLLAHLNYACKLKKPVNTGFLRGKIKSLAGKI
jgi:signal transduction histidine kinase